MLILGLLLVVVSGAAAAVLIAYNSGGVAETVSAFGRDLTDVTLMQAFVAGIVVALVFLLGLWMIVSAGRRSREHRARYREARRDAKAAAKERDQLAERVRKDEEVRAEQETVAMPVVERTGEQPTVTQPADKGRHAAESTDRHQQPVITNIHDSQTQTK
jgi:ABC-type nickel/cobalt efflux system permease component RcnA